MWTMALFHNPHQAAENIVNTREPVKLLSLAYPLGTLFMNRQVMDQK